MILMLIPFIDIRQTKEQLSIIKEILSIAKKILSKTKNIISFAILCITLLLPINTWFKIMIYVGWIYNGYIN
jgi:hypothetical protein